MSTINQTTLLSIPVQQSSWNIKKCANLTLFVLGLLSAIGLGVTIGIHFYGLLTPQLFILSVKINASISGIAVFALFWQKTTPHLPEKIRLFANYIQAIVFDFFSVFALGAIFWINLDWLEPKKSSHCKENQTPILFIHGFLGSSNNWIYHRHRLKAVGYENLFTINLGSPFKSIEDYACKLEAKIAHIKQLTGSEEIIFVCHSMGGLVARQYIYNRQNNDIKVSKVITIGTPLQGTIIAKIAAWASKAAEQMLWKSVFTNELNEKAKNDNETCYYHLGTQTEIVVLPSSSATSRRSIHDRVQELEATGHIGYLFSDATSDFIIQSISSDPSQTAYS